MRNGPGREVVIVEAVRTPIGRGHPEKGYYKDVHPNALLAKS
jgi:acetyl-CoA acyltransferase